MSAHVATVPFLRLRLDSTSATQSHSCTLTCRSGYLEIPILETMQPSLLAPTSDQGLVGWGWSREPWRDAGGLSACPLPQERPQRQERPGLAPRPQSPAAGTPGSNWWWWRVCVQQPAPPTCCSSTRLPTNNTTLPLSAQVEAGKPNLRIRPNLVAFVQQ